MKMNNAHWIILTCVIGYVSGSVIIVQVTHIKLDVVHKFIRSTVRSVAYKKIAVSAKRKQIFTPTAFLQPACVSETLTFFDRWCLLDRRYRFFFLIFSCRHYFFFLPPQLVSLLLIGVAAWGKWFGLVSSIRVVAGVIGVGIFLFMVAFVGLCGALKHHQVLLFFVSFCFPSWFLCLLECFGIKLSGIFIKC